MFLRKSTSRSQLPFAALALCGVMLAGCASDDLALDDTYVSVTPSERYPIEYVKGPVTMEVATHHGSLRPDQANAVAGFARRSMGGGATPITIRRPAGGGASARMARDIASIVTRQGVPRGMIRMATYPAPASAPVQIVYVKGHAFTKPCGEWPRDLTETSKNEPAPNHGCAVQSNIAAMIADPDDIVSPEPVTLAPAAGRTAAIKKISNGQGSSGFGSIFSIF